MNKRFLLFPLMAILMLFGCTTNDVDGDKAFELDPDKYYEIPDAAFAEMLEYNVKYQTSSNYKLPEGIVFNYNDKWYLSKEIAQTITSPKVVYLTQNATNLDNLKAYGYSGTPIRSIAGIENFTNATAIYITDSNVEGVLDLRSLSQLAVLQARRTNISTLLLPPTMTDVRCEPKADAIPENKLTELDLSECVNINNIVLNKQTIPADKLLLPEEPTASSITVSLTDATGLPYLCSQAFFDKLTSDSQSFFKVAGARDLYEISDANFALYLKYNMNELAADNAYKLPEGLLVEGTDANAGKYFIDKEIAATVEQVGINQASGWDTPLKEKGYNVTGKITNIDGIQFFTNITKLSMTSGTVVGDLDVSMLSKLKTLYMNANLCSSVKLPASIETFNYNASTSATDEQKLKSIDLSGCNNLKSTTLTKHNLDANSFNAPVAPANSDISVTLTGNPGVPFNTTQGFYEKLKADSKAFFTDPILATINNFSLVWDAAGQKKATRPTSWKYTSSAPETLSSANITNEPTLVMATEMAAEAAAGNADAFGATVRREKATSLADAIANGFYYTVQVTSSTKFSFKNLTTTVYSSASGAQKIDFQYSTDGTTFKTISTVSDIATSETGTSVNIDLSEIKDIPAGTVTFRIVTYANGGTAATGTTYIVNSREGNTAGPKVLTITGTNLK